MVFPQMKHMGEKNDRYEQSHKLTRSPATNETDRQSAGLSIKARVQNQYSVYRCFCTFYTTVGHDVEHLRCDHL